jgi:hypothetical protein
MKDFLQYALIVLGEGLRRTFWGFVVTFALYLANFYLFYPIFTERLGWTEGFLIHGLYGGQENFIRLQERDLAGYLRLYIRWYFGFASIFIPISLLMSPPRVKE